MNTLLRNTWVEIDLDQFAHNVRVLQDYVGPDVRLAPVIKADAYAHGAITIAEELGRLDVAYLAVAVLSEAMELRDHNIRSPVLVMGYTEDKHLGLAVEKEISVTIFDHAQAAILSREATRRNRVAHAHVKVDTGFHRLGKEPSEKFAEEILGMSRLPHLALDGILSHLRLEYTDGDKIQYERFVSFLGTLKARGLQFPYAHICDSIGAVKYPEFAMDMVRPGAILYGYVPKYQLGLIDVKPVMTFKTRVTSVRTVKKGEGIGYDEDFRTENDMVVATLPVGYADGYTRALSRVGEVLIQGRRARVIGIVCMDQMMVDVSSIDGVAPGDEAILFGPQERAPSVEELSGWAKTNRNSIVAAISRRVPRVYLKDGAVHHIVDYLTHP